MLRPRRAAERGHFNHGWLDTYRDGVDRFMAAMDAEFYEHYSGLKDEFKLGPIYERYSDLSTLETCQRLCESYTTDGGHLNPAGKQLAARGFYALAAAVLESNRISPASLADRYFEK